VGDLGADRPAADEASLEEQMGVALHQQVVLERPRLALVGVAGDVLGQRRVLQDELPLQPGRKPGAAAPAEPRRLDQVDHLARLHAERLLQAGVAFVLQIEVKAEAVWLAYVLRKDWVHRTTRLFRGDDNSQFPTPNSQPTPNWQEPIGSWQ